MRRVVICFALLLALAGKASSQGPSDWTATPSDLSKPCEVRLGQIYALSLQHTAEIFMEISGWKAPILVSFDMAGSMLSIDIIGSASTIDAAKESVEEFRSKVLERALTAANMALRANVLVDQLTISYVNTSTLNSVITFQHGTFLIN